MNWDADDQLIHTSSDEDRGDADHVEPDADSDADAPSNEGPAATRPHGEFATLYNDPGVPDAPMSFDDPAAYLEPPIEMHVDEDESVHDPVESEAVESEAVESEAVESEAVESEAVGFELVGEPDAESQLIEATGHDAGREAGATGEAPTLSDMWATPTDWGAAWDAPADPSDEGPTDPGVTPFGTASTDSFGAFPASASASTESHVRSKRTPLFSAGQSAAQGQSALPTIGEDLDTEMPYSPGQPPPMAEPLVKADPAFGPPAPESRSRGKISVLQVVLGLMLAGAIAYTVVSYLSDDGDAQQATSSADAPTTLAPTTLAPTTTVLDAAAATFTSTPVGDGWTQVASIDGGVRLQLPSVPKVAAAAGTGGLVSLTADLAGGGRVELIWSPIQPGLAPEVTSFMAMTTARERYPQLVTGTTQELGGLRYADGSGSTSTELLRARVTMTDRFAFVVLMSVPVGADQPAAGAQWFRILDSLEITG